ncbi:MAG: hypothetical protein AAF206_08890 [Bacteroidota bacterium]
MFEQIEAYLAGELTADEKTAFEHQLQTDPQLAEEVALQRDTHQLLDLYQQVSYKEKLKVIDAELQATPAAPKVVPLFQRRGFQLAAAAVMILVVAAFLLGRGGKSANQIAQEAFSPYPNLMTLKGESNLDSIMSLGLTAYSVASYPTAIEELRLVVSQQNDNTDAVFYLGLSLLSDKQFTAAIQHLAPLKGDAKYGQTASWYLALAYLFDENVDQGENTLKEIVATPSHAYKDKASGILEKL